jgi:hypothetical protein
MLSAYGISPMIVNLYVATPFALLTVEATPPQMLLHSNSNKTKTDTKLSQLHPLLHRPPHHPPISLRTHSLPELQPYLIFDSTSLAARASRCLASG